MNKINDVEEISIQSRVVAEVKVLATVFRSAAGGRVFEIYEELFFVHSVRQLFMSYLEIGGKETYEFVGRRNGLDR